MSELHYSHIARLRFTDCKQYCLGRMDPHVIVAHNIGTDCLPRGLISRPWLKLPNMRLALNHNCTAVQIMSVCDKSYRTALTLSIPDRQTFVALFYGQGQSCFYFYFLLRLPMSKLVPAYIHMRTFRLRRSLSATRKERAYFGAFTFREWLVLNWEAVKSTASPSTDFCAFRQPENNTPTTELITSSPIIFIYQRLCRMFCQCQTQVFPITQSTLSMSKNSIAPILRAIF